MCLAVINSIKTPKQYASHWGEQDLTKAGINKNKIYNVSQRMIYSPLSYAHNSLSSIESYQSKNLCYTIRKDLDSLQNAEFADRVDKEPKKSMGRVLSFFYKIGSLFPLLPTSNITDVEKTIFNLEEKINKMAYFPPSSEKDPTACKIRCAVLYAETNESIEDEQTLIVNYNLPKVQDTKPQKRLIPLF